MKATQQNRHIMEYGIIVLYSKQVVYHRFISDFDSDFEVYHIRSIFCSR